MLNFIKRIKRLSCSHSLGILIVFLTNANISASKEDYELSELFDLSLEELINVKITVASLFEESNREVASTVNAISRADWEKRGAKTVTEAIAHLPSTQVLDSLTASKIIAIRGFTGITSARGIQYQFEGVPLSDYAFGSTSYGVGNIGLGTLQRIEMIRGPGSALYGADAFHGVISYQAMDYDETTVKLNMAAGSNTYYQSDFHYSNGESDVLEVDTAISLSGQHQQNRAFTYTADTATNLSRNAEYDYEYQTHSLYLKATKPHHNDAQTAVTFLLNEHKPDSYPGISPICQSSSLPVTSPVKDCFHGSEKQLLLGKIAYQQDFVNTLQLELSAYHWQTDAEHVLPIVVPRAVHKEVMELDEQRSGAKALLKQQRSNSTWVQQWAIGAEYTHEKVDEVNVTFNGVPTSVDTVPKLQSGDSRQFNSLFFQAESNIIPNKLKTIYGVRLDKYQSFGNQYTPRVGLIYDSDKYNTFKLLWGTAFRSPSGFALKGDAVLSGDEDTSPEDIETYEISWTFSRDKHRHHATLFESTIKNKIQLRPTVTGSAKPLAFTNSTDNDKSYGLEYEYTLIEGDWTTEFNASYVKSKNEGTGENFVAFPRRIVNLNISKDLPTFNTLISVNTKVHDGMNSGPSSDKSLPTFWQTDIHIRKTFDNDNEVYFDISNIFDRENYSPSVWNVENGFPQEDVNLTLGFKFPL